MKLTRDVVYFVIIAVLVATCGQFWYDYKYKPWRERDVAVYYNRDIAANQELIKVIQDADKFVYFAIYTFTRQDIKDALLGAQHRGVKIKGVVDEEQTQKVEQQRAIVRELEQAGIPLAFDDHSAIMHLKTLVTEKAYISGSYNWTASATDSNDEVLEIGRDESLRRQYEAIVRKLFEKYNQ